MSENTKRNRTRDQQDGSKTEYRIGYRRPPKHTQFRPGHSGNPRGRPSRQIAPAENHRMFRDQLFHLSAMQVTVIENGKRQKMPMMMGVIRQAQQLALNGNLTAIKLLITLYTKLLEDHEVSQVKFAQMVLEQEARWEKECEENDPRTPEQKKAYEEARKNLPPREPGEDFMRYLRRTRKNPVKKS